MPGPVELFFLAAGVLIARGDMTLAAVWAVITFGNVAGNLIGYLLGRWGGRPLFDAVAQRLHFKEQGVRSAEHWFRRYGAVSQTFSRLIGVTRTPAILSAGVMRAPLLPFLVGSLIGDAIWSLFWALIGVGIGTNLLPMLSEHWALATGVLIGVVLGAAAVWLYLKKRLAKR